MKLRRAIPSSVSSGCKKSEEVRTGSLCMLFWRCRHKLETQVYEIPVHNSDEHCSHPLG